MYRHCIRTCLVSALVLGSGILLSGAKAEAPASHEVRQAFRIEEAKYGGIQSLLLCMQSTNAKREDQGAIPRV